MFQNKNYYKDVNSNMGKIQNNINNNTIKSNNNIKKLSYEEIRKIVLNEKEVIQNTDEQHIKKQFNICLKNYLIRYYIWHLKQLLIQRKII